MATYTHTFLGFVPPVRYDDEPWTQARIEESATEDGTFAEVETIALDPVDTDPTSPATRNLTTDEASLEEGWFRIVFLDAEDQESPHSDPIFSPLPTPNVDFPVPTVAQVALVILARTKEEMTRVGTFTDATKPTAAQVRELIDQGVARVATRVGAVGEANEAQATDLAALYAAMLVELSYFPEQVADGQSPYEELKALFEDGLASLVGAVTDGPGQTKGIFSVPLRSETAPELLS